jgi:hypothetical protein
MIRCASTGVPSVLSMDCEMCETTDPVTGEKCDNALIRFSVVDCLDGGKVRTFTLLCGFAVNSILCKTVRLYCTSLAVGMRSRLLVRSVGICYSRPVYSEP